MTVLHLAAKSLRHRWPLSLLTLFCLGLASSVLIGAFLVGDSIKSGLRSRLVEPLGGVNHAFVSPTHLSATRAEEGAGLVFRYDGSAQNEKEATLGGVTTWGVDESFLKLIDYNGPPPAPGTAWVTQEAAQKLKLRKGSFLFLRLPDPKAPAASAVFAKRDPMERTLEVQVEVSDILPDKGVGRFDLVPSFGGMRGVFLSRSWLSDRMKVADGGNVAVGPSSRLVSGLSLRDFGLSFQPARSAGGWVLHSDGLVMPDDQVQAAASLPGSRRVSIALADQFSSGSRSASYGVAAWIEGESPGINEWAAEDLNWSEGDHLRARLLLSRPDGSYGTHEAAEEHLRSLPMKGMGGEPAFIPAIDGVTDATRVDAWDPPFPLDQQRITQRDEDYWERYRAAPRLFLSREEIRSSWNGREAITGIWFPSGSRQEIESALLAKLIRGLPGQTVNLREAALKSAEGSTDMTSLILALGFFLLLSALGLAGSVFRLIVIQDSKSVALLRALGIPQGTVRKVFIAQGLLLGAAGSLAGILGGVLFASSALSALSSLLRETFPRGTLSLEVNPLICMTGAAGSLAFVIWPVMGGLREAKRLTLIQTIRGGSSLLAARKPSRVWQGWLCLGILVAGCGLFLSGPTKDLVSGFGAFCCAMGCAARLLGGEFRPGPTFSFTKLVWRLSQESRSGLLLTFFLSGMAAYMLGAVASQASLGGISESRLILRTTLPMEISLATHEGRERLGFTEEELKATEGIKVLSFLIGPGQDASCLNPAKPVKPRFIGLPYETAREHPFFMEPKSAWMTLTHPSPQNPAPALGDHDTVLWTLFSGVGKEMAWEGEKSVKFAGLIKDSPLAREVMVSQADFQSVYPSITSPSLFVITPTSQDILEVERLREALQSALAPLGPEVTLAKDEIAQVKRVQLSYMVLFLALGSFGLILGMAGSAFASAREVAARRQQYALLRALGVPSNKLLKLVLLPGSCAGLGGALVGLICSGPGLFSTDQGLLLTGLLIACTCSIAFSSLFAAAQWKKDSHVDALRSE